MPNFILNSLLLLCILEHTLVDAVTNDREIKVVKISDEIFEYSSPNYPGAYDNRLDLVKTVNLSDSSKYLGFFIEIIDFQLKDEEDAWNFKEGSYDYLLIQPLSTTDNTDVSDLVTSVDNFYNTKIGAKGLKAGDIVKLPNLSSFNIRFKTNSFYNQVRGWKIKVSESDDTSLIFCDTNYHTVNGRPVSSINPCIRDFYGSTNQWTRCSKTNPCLHGGTCSDDEINGPQCNCAIQYKGKTCQKCAKNYHTANGQRVSKNNVCISDFYESKNQWTKCSKTNPCLHGGICTDDKNNGPQCKCATRYTGATCQICATNYHTADGLPVSKTNTCIKDFYGSANQWTRCTKTNPCLQGGICSDDKIKGPQCSCANEYKGKICQTCSTNYHTANGLPVSDTNACISDFYGSTTQWTRCTKTNPCLQGGTCTDDETNGPQCTCATGYKGTICQTCAANYHTANGLPVSETNACISDFYKPRSQWNRCSKINPCLQGGKCTDDEINGPQCNCTLGYTGTTCQTCATDYHTANGLPVSNTNACINDFYGSTNQWTKCSKTNPCLHGGICTDDETDGPQCSCATGYRGTTCQSCTTNYHTANGLPVSNDNACISDFYGSANKWTRCTKTNPCLQGGICTDDDTLGPQCDCATGYTGTTCQICATNYHTADGLPVKKTNACIKDFYGSINQWTRCTKTNPCLQGGICSDNEIYGPQCTCATGYTGVICQFCDSEYHTANGQPVSSTNPCISDYYGTSRNPYNGAFDLENGSSDTSGDGSGDGSGEGAQLVEMGNVFNEIFFVKCTKFNPCFQGGTCIDDKINGPQCGCTTGYTGTTCQTCDTDYHTANGLPVSDTNACINDSYGSTNQWTRCTKTNPCLQGGTCADDEINGPQCSCAIGYIGTTCQTCATDYHTANGQPVSKTNMCVSDFYGSSNQWTRCTKTNPCWHDGTCTDDETNGPQCTCASGYTGKTCQTCATDYHTANGQPVSKTNACISDFYGSRNQWTRCSKSSPCLPGVSL